MIVDNNDIDDFFLDVEDLKRYDSRNPRKQDFNDRSLLVVPSKFNKHLGKFDSNKTGKNISKPSVNLP